MKKDAPCLVLRLIPLPTPTWGKILVICVKPLTPKLVQLKIQAAKGGKKFYHYKDQLVDNEIIAVCCGNHTKPINIKCNYGL